MIKGVLFVHLSYRYERKLDSVVASTEFALEDANDIHLKAEQLVRDNFKYLSNKYVYFVVKFKEGFSPENKRVCERFGFMIDSSTPESRLEAQKNADRIKKYFEENKESLKASMKRIEENDHGQYGNFTVVDLITQNDFLIAEDFDDRQ
jgi:hypothetical protein